MRKQTLTACSMVRRGPALRVLAALLALVAACQGDFERPALDHPNDPVNGNLPPTPDLTRVEPVGCSDDGPRIEIEWSAGDTGIAEYQLFRATSETEDPGRLVLHVPGGNLSAIDEGGLDESARYIYRVRAVSTEGVVGSRSDSLGATASCR